MGDAPGEYLQRYGLDAGATGPCGARRGGDAPGTDEPRRRDRRPIADDPERSLITLQVEMGVAVRMACLELLVGAYLSGSDSTGASPATLRTKQLPPDAAAMNRAERLIDAVETLYRQAVEGAPGSRSERSSACRPGALDSCGSRDSTRRARSSGCCRRRAELLRASCRERKPSHETGGLRRSRSLCGLLRLRAAFWPASVDEWQRRRAAGRLRPITGGGGLRPSTGGRGGERMATCWSAARGRDRAGGPPRPTSACELGLVERKASRLAGIHRSRRTADERSNRHPSACRRRHLHPLVDAGVELVGGDILRRDRPGIGPVAGKRKRSARF